MKKIQKIEKNDVKNFRMDERLMKVREMRRKSTSFSAKDLELE